MGDVLRSSMLPVKNVVAVIVKGGAAVDVQVVVVAVTVTVVTVVAAVVSNSVVLSTMINATSAANVAIMHEIARTTLTTSVDGLAPGNL